MPNDERNRNLPETGMVVSPKVVIANDPEIRRLIEKAADAAIASFADQSLGRKSAEATRRLVAEGKRRQELKRRYESAEGVEKELFQLLLPVMSLPLGVTASSHVAVSTEEIVRLADEVRLLQTIFTLFERLTVKEAKQRTKKR